MEAKHKMVLSGSPDEFQAAIDDALRVGWSPHGPVHHVGGVFIQWLYLDDPLA